MATVQLQANNRIWLTYRHFPYKAHNAVAELVDNSVQSYLDNKKGPKSPAPTTAADTNGEKKDAGQRKGGPRNTEQPEQLARRTAFTDALWALINTREFILNH